MGRHSLPDPEDSGDEPVDDYRADDLDADDTGRHLSAGQETDAPGSFTDYRRYRDAGHYVDEEYFGAGEDDAADEEFAAGEDAYPADGAFAVDAADEYPEFAPRTASAAGA